MKITPRQRQISLIAIAIALALVAVVVFENEDKSRGAASAAIVAPVAQAPKKAAAPALPKIPLERLDEKISRDPVGDVFEARSWEPPPPPPKKIVPPPPQAPPLPYTYAGKILDGDQIVVFLMKQGRSYVVKQGETIDGSYRIDDIKGETMVFTYLPLSKQQLLAIGAAN